MSFVSYLSGGEKNRKFQQNLYRKILTLTQKRKIKKLYQ